MRQLLVMTVCNIKCRDRLSLRQDVADLLHGFFYRSVAQALNELEALCVALFDVLLVLQELLITLADGGELRDHSLAYGCLEVAVALAVKVALDLLVAQPRDSRVYRHQVVDAVLALAVAHLSLAVGDSALKFLHDHVIFIGEQDVAVGVLVRLAHLRGRILQTHHARAVLGDEALGDLEHVAVYAVEAVGYVAGQLKMLHLV